MVDGVRLALAQRDFEAGSFSVGYQSCGTSTAQAGSEDFFRCGSLAKALARNLNVVGVFGSFTSFCSYTQIPIANQAPEGPLAMISPSNTYAGLTEDDELYPVGTRNYFRLAAAESYHGLAQIALAKELGHDGVFMLISRGGEYAATYPIWMRAHAKRVGVEIVGEATFDPDAASFAALSRRVAAARPESVAIVGLLTPRTAALVRQLRAALGPDVSMSAPDAFQLPDLFELAGPAGRACTSSLTASRTTCFRREASSSWRLSRPRTGAIRDQTSQRATAPRRRISCSTRSHARTGRAVP
jgi:ABC-type branched-subunit amino acid transport system substrate-binding protein